MEPRTSLWSSSTFRVLVRREGPSRKTEKKLPVRLKENQEQGIIQAQKKLFPGDGVQCYLEFK